MVPPVLTKMIRDWPVPELGLVCPTLFAMAWDSPMKVIFLDIRVLNTTITPSTTQGARIVDRTVLPSTAVRSSNELSQIPSILLSGREPLCPTYRSFLLGSI
jgi:hypothetical protein